MRLYARAIPTHERMALLDAAARLPRGASGIDYALALIATTLETEDGSKAVTRAEVDALDDARARMLTDAVAEALAVCAPEFNDIHVGSWRERLKEGARVNIGTAWRMSSAFDVGYMVRKRRPDLYWGKPLVSLTDGQFLAYDAACEVVAAMQEK